MTEEERWHAFEVEIIRYVIFDNRIESDEKILIDSIAPLYFRDAQKINLPAERWDEIYARLNEVLPKATRDNKERENSSFIYKNLAKNIIFRLVEPQHKNLPKKNFHWFCDWLLKQHAPENDYWVIPNLKHLGNSIEQTTSSIFKTFTPKENIIGYPSEIISSSYNKWKQIPVAPDEVEIKLDEESLINKLKIVFDPIKSDKWQNELKSLLENTTKLVENMPFYKKEYGKVWFIDNLEEEQEIWFAGDVHGDLLAFEAVCQCFEGQKKENAKLIFLGDMIDRGAHELEVLYSLLTKINNFPETYGWIAGNHDIGMVFSDDEQLFKSRTTPAEFTSYLNEQINNETLVSIGKLLIEISNHLPQAIFFPGLLATHGGFPHSDLWENIKQPSDLMEEQCLIDFTHNRIHLSKNKIPNRASHSSQFGSEDFSGFRAICQKIGLDVKSMVRGHDHVSATDHSARWDRPTKVRRGDFEARVLTINTLCYNQTGEMSSYSPANPRKPVIARWRVGDTFPTPYVINLSSNIVDRYIKPCKICKKPTIESACNCKIEDR